MIGVGALLITDASFRIFQICTIAGGNNGVRTWQMPMDLEPLKWTSEVARNVLTAVKQATGLFSSTCKKGSSKDLLRT